MRSWSAWITVTIALLALGGSGASGAPSRQRVSPRSLSGKAGATPAVSYTDLAANPQFAATARSKIGIWGHGSWCWFGDPRAVRVVGQYDQTFIGWIDWSGRVVVGAYAASFGVMRTHVVGQLYHDDHGSPAIFVEPDKRLTVFFSGHDGPTMMYRTTLRPEDISAWGPLYHVRSRIPGKLGFTYPNPILVPAEQNRTFLFWRGADWSQEYAVRTIDGRWSPARRLISAPGQRPYVKAVGNGNDTISLAFTNGHPRERITSIYYAAYRHGALWSASGRKIAPLSSGPIAPQRADLVYDGLATGVSGWVWDVALDAHGRPVIVYATFPTVQNHAYWYARWTGARWVSHLMTFAGGTISPGTLEQQYSGGLALDHSDPSIVYLSRKVMGSFEIERWTTRDGGSTWHYSTVVRANGVDNVRPIVTRASNGGPMSLLWLRGPYGAYTNYHTSIAFLK